MEYTQKLRSPHSGLLKEAGELEWVRVYEVDKRIHSVVKVGKQDLKYDAELVTYKLMQSAKNIL